VQIITLLQAKGNEQEIIREMLGTSFTKISAGLAGSWNMGSMLQLSLKDPDRRTCIFRSNPDTDSGITRTVIPR